MANRKKEYPVPKFSSLEEEDRYWQSHSPLMEDYEGKVQKKQQNRASFLSIRLTGEQLARLRQIAAQYDLGPSTYARQILLQAMETGSRSFSPTLIYNICSKFSIATGKPKEEDLKQLGDIIRNYSVFEEATAAQIVNLWLANLGIDSPHFIKHIQEKLSEEVEP